MNNYNKIKETLKIYVDVMKGMTNTQEIEVMHASLADLRSLAELNNRNGKIQINSIKANEAPLILFGVISSFLITRCREVKREELLDQFRDEMVKLFSKYSMDRRFIDVDAINSDVEENGIVKLEYPEEITNMFLNTASILACRILFGVYMNNVEEGLSFIEEYLVNNYLSKNADRDVIQISMQENN